MTNDTKQLIFKMLRENTGRAICDSGGENGRLWQRNADKTLADFEAEPAAQIEISKWQRDENEPAQYDAQVHISLFHHLARTLELDPYCREFNALECGNWNGEFYGTDQGQCDWLLDNGFTAKGDSFNSYNWSANFSQTIQGQILENDDGALYVLLQIHGGADVRGGYTDAKLFKLQQWISEYGLFAEDCGFSIVDGEDYISIDWRGNGELTDSEGDLASPELLAKIYQLTGGELVTGELFEINY